MARLFVIAAILLAPIYVQAVAFTNGDYSNVVPGLPFALFWSGDGTPVTIGLLTGPDSQSLQKVDTVATNAPGTSFAWVPSASLHGTYALSITQSGHVGPLTSLSLSFLTSSRITNYSPKFQVLGIAAHPPIDYDGPAFDEALPPYPAGPNNSSNTLPFASGSGTSAGFPYATSGPGSVAYAEFTGEAGKTGKNPVVIAASVVSAIFALAVFTI